MPLNRGRRNSSLSMTVCRQCQGKSHTARKVKPEIHLSVLSLHLTVTRWDEKHGIGLRETALLHIAAVLFQEQSSYPRVPGYLKELHKRKDQCAKHCADEYGNTGPAPQLTTDPDK